MSEPRARLGARPGWAQLREAAVELHAAEVLIGDALAPATTALPHLRGFWAALFAAAKAAGLASADAAGPEQWLSAAIDGVDASTRKAARVHWRELDASEGQAKSSRLRAHAWAARELFAAVEPVIGGVPLRRRRRSVVWAGVGLVILFAPVAIYVALTAKLEGEGPWRATYYADRKLEQAAESLREVSVDHDWKKDAPTESVPPDKFSARWDTCLELDEAASAAFQVNANDAARVYVDGELLIDAWERDARTRKRGYGSGTVELDAGLHHLRVEYFESLGSASIKLAVTFDDELPRALPAELLRYPGDELDEDDPCAAAEDGAGE